MISCENFNEQNDYLPLIGNKIYFSECPDWFWDQLHFRDGKGCFGYIAHVSINKNFVMVEIPGGTIRFDFDGSSWDHSGLIKRESWNFKGDFETVTNPESEGFI